MNNLFAQSRSHWVRYDRYEIKTGKDGKRYITPEKTAKPDIYNPLKDSSEMVLEALNVGMLMMNRRPEDVVEKAERSLERLTNEKIMAVNEYSDTVLQEIHKNHEEAMFLYDMLNNKHANIKDTVSKVDKAVKAAEDKVKAIDDTPAVKTEETEKVIPADEPAKTEEAVSPEIGFMGETAEEGQNNNEKILEMHRQGKSTVAIARELGLGVGEVKLVIDLYKA